MNQNCHLKIKGCDDPKKFVETWNAKKIIKTVEDFYPKIEWPQIEKSLLLQFRISQI